MIAQEAAECSASSRERRLSTVVGNCDHQRMLDVLRKGERDYREIADQMPQIVWTANPSGAIEFFNAYFYEYTGLDPQSALDWGWTRLSPPEERDSTVETWLAACRSGEAYMFEERLRRRDGIYRWNLATARPLRASDGTIRRWVGVTTDIDDQKYVERNLRILDEAGDILAASLDAKVNVQRVAEMIAAEVADWCGITLCDVEGELTQLLVAHRDPAQARLASEYLRRFPSRPDGFVGRVVRTGRSEFVPSISSGFPVPVVADSEQQRVLAAMAIRSVIVVPLTIRGRCYGAMQFVNSQHSRVFGEGDLRIAELIGKRIALAVDNSRVYERERRVADTFQRAALPSSLPQLDGASLAAVYRPAKSEAEVGGDWYDAFLLDDHQLVISIGDVAGKGLEAAVLMARVRQSLRVAAYRTPEPDVMLRVADAALTAEFPDHYVTAFIGVIDTRTWTMMYASAGHPPALLRRANGDVESLRGESPPLGLLDVMPTRHSVVLDKHELLVLYTDGVTESTRDVFEGERRLRDVLSTEAILRVNNPAEFVRELVLHDGDVEEGSRDDVAILAVRIDVRRHWNFDANDAVAAHGARSSFLRALRSHADPSSEFEAAELIFGELIGNVVRHAPGPIDIDLTWDDEAPVLHILDRGRGFDQTTVPPHDLVRESGRGLFIVRSLGTDFAVKALPGRGTHVSIRLPVRRASA